MSVLVGSTMLFAQTAPLGKDLVKGFSEKMQAYESIKAEFTFTLENLQEGFSDTHKGNLKFKGKSYFLELMGMQVYFDGKTKWQYIPEANEVTISEPTSLDGGFFDDPTQIFRSYEQDFKSKFMGEKIEKKVSLYEVDLYPEDISVPYSIIKIIFKKQNLEPVSIKYQGKDGINYIIDVKAFSGNQNLKDNEFTFTPAEHKGIVIVDML
ncbi:MAG: outer membrane lipoprotein carrier protein LolA [Bacteroidales bacterium]|nr:outer membrane lipoprotein carrier protein LolA [Bacteroidales bacterium]